MLTDPTGQSLANNGRPKSGVDVGVRVSVEVKVDSAEGVDVEVDVRVGVAVDVNDGVAVKVSVGVGVRVLVGGGMVGVFVFRSFSGQGITC